MRISYGISDVLDRLDRGYSIAGAYPVFPGADKVAKADTTEEPLVVGVDNRAPPKAESLCDGCRHSRAKDDWEHNRKIGECWFFRQWLFLDVIVYYFNFPISVKVAVGIPDTIHSWGF